MRIFHDFLPGRSGDGMTIDSAGNLYVAAGLNRTRGTSETLDTVAGVHVFSPAGELIEHIPVPEDTITNAAFGGAGPAHAVRHRGEDALQRPHRRRGERAARSLRRGTVLGAQRSRRRRWAGRLPGDGGWPPS